MITPENAHDFKIWKTIRLSSGEEIDFVVIASKEIGLPFGAYLNVLLEKAQQHGLLPCTEETAIELDVQYKDRPYWESFHFGMNPMRLHNGYIDGMKVYKLESKKLVTESCPHPQGFWGEIYKWIFIKPR